MDCQFVISNIHGYLRSFNQMLGEWDPEEETLVIAGNVIDYGHNSFLICKKLLELVNFYPGQVVFLKGEHESFFEEFIKNPASLYASYLEQGGLATLLSFYEDGLSYEEMNDRYYMLEAVISEISFVELLSYNALCLEQYETPHSIFLSHRNNLRDLINTVPIRDTRAIFLPSQEDPRFKLRYLNHYLPEKLIREDLLQSGDLSMFRNRYVLLGKEPSGWEEAYVWGHHIKNGVVTEMTQIPAEE